MSSKQPAVGEEFVVEVWLPCQTSGKYKKYKCNLCDCYFKFDDTLKATHINGHRHRHLYNVLFIIL